MHQSVLSIRVSPVVLRRVEELAEARGSTKAAAIRAAIVEATTPKDAPAVPTEREVLRRLHADSEKRTIPHCAH